MYRLRLRLVAAFARTCLTTEFNAQPCRLLMVCGQSGGFVDTSVMDGCPRLILTLLLRLPGSRRLANFWLVHAPVRARTVLSRFRICPETAEPFDRVCLRR